MRVLVCGGRDFRDFAAIKGVLEQVHQKTPIHAIIHGNASGADRLAGAWAKSQRNVAEWPVPAQWAKFGKSAGPRRNQSMLGLDPDLVIAFPGGRGTADMVKRAEKAGVPILHACAS